MPGCSLVSIPSGVESYSPTLYIHVTYHNTNNQLQLNYAELPKYKQQVPIEFEPGHFFEDQKNNDRQIPTLEGVFRKAVS